LRRLRRLRSGALREQERGRDEETKKQECLFHLFFSRMGPHPHAL